MNLDRPGGLKALFDQKKNQLTFVNLAFFYIPSSWHRESSQLLVEQRQMVSLLN